MVPPVPPQDNSTEAECSPVYSVRICQVSVALTCIQVNEEQNPGALFPTIPHMTWSLKKAHGMILLLNCHLYFGIPSGSLFFPCLHFFDFSGNKYSGAVAPAFHFKISPRIYPARNGCSVSETREIQIGTKATSAGGFSDPVRASSEFFQTKAQPCPSPPRLSL